MAFPKIASAAYMDYNRHTESLTTFHFLPSSSSTGGRVRAGLAAAVGREATGLGPVGKGPDWDLSAGFLWVFLSSDTCFSPYSELKDIGILKTSLQ